MVLTRGAQACHVYWQIGNSATFDTGTRFKGNVLAYQDISANTGATFEGRLLTTDGAVTLDTNTITVPECAAVVTPSTPAPTVTTPTTPAPTRTTPTRSTPRPTATTPSRDRDDSDGGGSGTDGGGSGTDGGDSFTDGDGGTTTTPTPGLPNAGGPPWFLAPLGGIAVLAGIGFVVVARSARGVHRA